MTTYDDLFATAAAENSVFADKGALDPLAAPDEVIARTDQEAALAAILSGVHEGYLPTTVSIYGPPGTGKTLTTRRVCGAFADREPAVAVEYVNLKECRTLFSAANEIHLELTGETVGAYAGLDGAFEGIWTALAAEPEWPILLLDEIDHVQHDSNYDPSDFFYRLLRGEGKLQRDINLSVWLLSNELLEVELRLDSRVESAMGGETVFFGPYDRAELHRILAPRVERAFRDGAFPDAVLEYAVREAARRWGDARKALRLVRQAGETANDRGLEAVTRACLDANIEATDREAVIERLLQLPFNHFAVLGGIASRTDRSTGELTQSVTTAEVQEALSQTDYPPELQIGERAIRTAITDLETMGLVETWIESRGRDGRVKQIEPTFDPQWVQDAVEPWANSSDLAYIFD